MRHLFVLDPLDRIENPLKDSTAALMQAARRASLESGPARQRDRIRSR